MVLGFLGKWEGRAGWYTYGTHHLSGPSHHARGNITMAEALACLSSPKSAHRAFSIELGKISE